MKAEAEARISTLTQKLVELSIDAIPVTGPGGRVLGTIRTADLLALLRPEEDPELAPEEAPQCAVPIHPDVPESLI